MRFGIAVVFALSVAACGGGDGDGDRPDSAPRPDAPAVADAPPFACQFDPAYPNVLNLGSAPGMMPGPVEFMAQRTTTTMDHAIAILATLPGRDVAPRAALFILMIDNAGMFLAAPFSSGPTGTFPINNGDVGSECGGCLEGYSGYELMGMNADLMTAQQVFLPDAGDLVFTTFGAPVEGVATDVFGSYDNIMMTGYDPATDPLVPNTCATSFTKLNFFFQPTWAPMTVAPTVDPDEPKGPYGIPWSQIVQVEATLSHE